MPSVKTITPILPDKYYHIFNRGSNRKTLFYTNSNYHYFLSLIGEKFIEHIDILAYCLLPNHFHLIIKTKACCKEDLISYRKTISSKFKSWLVSYAMAINKQEGFAGNLFDPKFKRLEIEDDEYLKYLIFYTHYNPEKHGVTHDFKEYSFSSYNAILSNKPTKLCRNIVIELFGGVDNFINYHQHVHQERIKLILE